MNYILYTHYITRICSDRFLRWLKTVQVVRGQRYIEVDIQTIQDAITTASIRLKTTVTLILYLSVKGNKN